MSCVQIDGWVKTMCMRSQGKGGEALWLAYRPMYIRAFEDAADSTADEQVKGAKTATSHDYVQFGEFRLLCFYLCIYGRMFDAFQAAVRVYIDWKLCMSLIA